MSSKAKKVVAAVAASAAVTAGAGVAYAFWTTSGTGTGTGSVADGASQALAVSGDASSPMAPGVAAQNVTATVQNNGSENYKVSTLTAYVTTNKDGCTGADFVVNGSTSSSAAPVDLGVTATDLAPNATVTKGYTLGFNNTADNQDACKGAAVTVHYSAS